MKNKLILQEMKTAGLYKYQLALILGVSEATITRFFRIDHPAAEQQAIVDKIRAAKKEGESHV